MALTYRKPVSSVWQDFAHSIVSGAGVLDDQVSQNIINAMASVSRDLFVEPNFALRALEDASLPIGFDKVSGRPSHVARMLGLIGLRRGLRILEIGCGSGYTSAVMAAAGAQVYSLEAVGLLAQRTRKLLDSIGFQNVLIRSGGGVKGWPEHAPYDAIIISNPIDAIPAELIEQLNSESGRLVAAMGSSSRQVLTLKQLSASSVSSVQLEELNLLDS